MSSLASLCLASLSHNFHLLSAADMAVLPSHLAPKLFTRLVSDRGYDLLDDSDPRPDAATLWAFSTLAGIKKMPTWTLQLPQQELLQQLGGFDRVDEKEHPLVALPKYFASLQPDMRLLTTLRLRGLDDSGLQAIKHLGALTVLDTPVASITDDGVRLLAAATSVPERRGAWGLRAWFMTDCVRVTDKSMRSLVRFSGLALLDLRRSGCSPAAIHAFNKANKAWDPATDFLPVTPGLRGLFGRDELDSVLEKLCLTLLAPDVAPKEGEQVEEGHRTYFSLHVEPAAHELEPDWLHAPPRQRAARGDSYNWKSSYNAAHGQLWGSGVSMLHDEAKDLRRRVKTALEMQAEDDYADYCEENGLPIPLSRQERAYNDTVKRRKKERADKKRWMEGRVAGSAKMTRAVMGGDQYLHRFGHVVPKSKEEIEAEERLVAMSQMEGDTADERSRRFAAAEAAAAVEKKARRSHALSKDQQMKSTQGNKNLMLVRMLPLDWRDARWIPAQKEAAPASQAVSVKKRADAGEAVYDLLASAGIVLDDEEQPSSEPQTYEPPVGSQVPASSSPAPTPTRTPRTHPFFKPAVSSSSPAAATPSQAKRTNNPFAKAPPSSQSSQSQSRGFNPFQVKGRGPEVSSLGVKKLAPVLGEKRRLEASQASSQAQGAAKRNVFRKL